MNPSTDQKLLPQGDVGLLAEPAAQALLASALPARLAYVNRSGQARIVPTWFHWNGEEIVMTTWVSGPHVRHPARRLEDLRARPDVTISIDTDDARPVALQVRGRAALEEVPGIAIEYQRAAERYLGKDASRELLAQLDPATVVMARITVKPAWVGLIDFDHRLPGPLGGVNS